MAMRTFRVTDSNVGDAYLDGLPEAIDHTSDEELFAAPPQRINMARWRNTHVALPCAMAMRTCVVPDSNVGDAYLDELPKAIDPTSDGELFAAPPQTILVAMWRTTPAALPCAKRPRIDTDGGHDNDELTHGQLYDACMQVESMSANHSSNVLIVAQLRAIAVLQLASKAPTRPCTIT